MTGFEPAIINAAAKALAGVVIKSAWDSGGSWFKKMKLTESIQQLVYDAARKYVESYRKRHGMIKVLGMPEPLNLENIYTAVQSIEQRDIWRYSSLADQNKAYRESGNRSFQSKSKKEDGIKIANCHQYLMILGQPGAGKSTFLRWIGLESLKGKKGQYQYLLMPVLIELKLFNSGELNLIKIISEELKICGFPDPEESTNKLLENGKLLILLDGLDEIPSENLSKSMQQIQNFVDTYSQNRFIASCRTAAHTNGFTQFKDVEIADFDDRQIQEFIKNWFSREEDRTLGIADECWKSLSSPGYIATKELAHNPLLLTFLCLVFDNSQVFPKNRAELYQDALDILMRKWSAEKKIQRQPIYKKLTLILEETMLSRIAYTQFNQDKLFFEESNVLKEIHNCLLNNLNAPKDLDEKDVLLAIQIEQGIIVERSRKILSFSHLTLQEYLTAKYIVDNNLIDELVMLHLTDNRWREVFLLVAGSMRGGTDLLLNKMASATGSLINTSKLHYLVKWTEHITQVSGVQTNSLAKRHLALSISNSLIIAYTITQAYSFENACANVSPHIDTYACKIAARNVDPYNVASHSATPYSSIIINANAIANDIANDYINATSFPSQTSYEFGIVDVNLRIIDSSILLINSLFEQQVFTSLDWANIRLRFKHLSRKIVSPTSRYLHREILEEILLIWFQALSINLQGVDLSRVEIDDLQRYIPANLLISQCKEVAIDVSPDGWEKVEQMMFRVI